jgi:hypothetical protein
MYHYNGKEFEDYSKVMAEIQVDHPELGDAALVDFFESNVWED